jgi:hypothetical protein
MLVAAFEIEVHVVRLKEHPWNNFGAVDSWWDKYLNSHVYSEFVGKKLTTVNVFNRILVCLPDFWMFIYINLMCSSLCFSGTTLNYFLDNRINKAEILFAGVACFLVAVILGSAVHASNAADNEEKLNASNKLGWVIVFRVFLNF